MAQDNLKELLFLQLFPKCLKKNKLNLGSINTIRDFNYVLDTVDGMFQIMET